MNKSVILFALFATLTTLVNAQLTFKDGKYYDQDNNLYTGVYTEYYESGNKKVEMNVVKGEKHGSTTLYFDNKKINEVRSFKNNEMDGTWITYDEVGTKTAEARYKDGVKDGKWYIWDENRVLRYEMLYSNGKKIGSWKIWDEEGKLVAEKNY
nr:toxin-antitoxin system YwqK family antitoxin [uncultured Carboxylicivirga sp.]